MATVVSSGYSATLFSANFDTDQSALFAVVRAPSGATDSTANFVYDYSTHVQGGGFTPIPIPSAPNSTGGTTQGLRMSANDGAEVVNVDGIVAYPNVTGLPANAWRMTVDVWANYNGNAGGSSGSTQATMLGATTTSATVCPFAGGPGTGFYLTMTGEGGAAADYRTVIGAGNMALNQAATAWHGGAFYNNLDSVWQSFYQSPPYQTAGAPGKAWNTYRLTVNGSTAQLEVKRPSDTAFQLVAITNGLPAGLISPLIGHTDINAGVPTPLSLQLDNFSVFDNLVIEDLPTAAKDWKLYE
ncbi:MAG: hypothetical protein N2111_03285 [Candidatus Sumerlaeaceae bacterium]|nr:hypothetical protein [Candidatus Sumerlaeaceae bacterium]